MDSVCGRPLTSVLHCYHLFTSSSSLAKRHVRGCVMTNCLEGCCPLVPIGLLLGLVCPPPCCFDGYCPLALITLLLRLTVCRCQKACHLPCMLITLLPCRVLPNSPYWTIAQVNHRTLQGWPPRLPGMPTMVLPITPYYTIAQADPLSLPESLTFALYAHHPIALKDVAC